LLRERERKDKMLQDDNGYIYDASSDTGCGCDLRVDHISELVGNTSIVVFVHKCYGDINFGSNARHVGFFEDD